MNILLFSSAETTLARAGGKGANLADLARAGFPVPPGFIVSTAAYQQFVLANQLQASILDLTHGIAPEDSQRFEKAAQEIRSLFERGTLPGELAAEISSAYQALSPDQTDLPVAVRSSATAEDLPGLAFAGQQETYLNQVGETSVLAAVKKCWSSLWTARAMSYRERNHIASAEGTIAVVIQKMIDSQASGVLFTANPITGRRDEMVIDASFGLGEAIVSGQVDPDHFLVNPAAWTITQRKLGEKKMAILLRPGGGTQAVIREGANEPALSDAQIIPLAQTSRRVADHFGAPQDIEWAWADGQMYLLQSRPITSLYPLPENPHPEQGLRYYVNFNSVQGVTDPLTPVGMDALRLLFGGVTRLLHLKSSMVQLLPDAGGRLFIDFTDLVRDPRLRAVGFNLLANTDPGARDILIQLMETRAIEPKRVLTPARIASLMVGILPILRQAISAMLSPDRVYPRAVAMAEPLIGQMQAHANTPGSLRQVIQIMEQDLPRTESISFGIMPSVLPVFSLLPVIDGWLSKWLGEPTGSANWLLQGLSHNVTVEMNLKLWSVAQAIRADASVVEWLRAQPVDALGDAYLHRRLPPIAQQALEGFFAEYGMRGVAEIDLGRAPWREDPSPILQTLLGYLQIEDPASAPDVLYRRGTDQTERLAASYIDRVRRTRFGWLRAKILKAAIHRVRTLAGLREVPLFYMVRINDLYRVAMLRCAGELTARGTIDRAEDIFFVPLESLKQYSDGNELDLKTIAAANQALYEREKNRRQMPEVLLSNGEAFYPGIGPSAEDGEDLVGEAVSPGVVEGRAHVILDPGRERLEPGEILVCPSTDPGWTPLFLTAAGLVMEIGGLITHGSIVAREYGLPAVVGISQATTRLKTGQLLRVDGNRGRVTVIAASSAGFSTGSTPPRREPAGHPHP
jgi:pyruvate,water dikinase